MKILPELYPLTGLQIGDIQSYVSWAFLYFAVGSNKVLILVDNRPWLMNNHSRSAKIWQLMVTKYRMSPFTNTRALNKASNTNQSKTGNNDVHESRHNKSKRSNRWFPAIDPKKWQEMCMDLSIALHGFIVFEVAWKDVRGINYLSELQTDTTLALEVKSMRKWEFYSPDQASSCISSWFCGISSESQSLKKNLMLLADLDIHQWNAYSSSILFQKPSLDDVQSDDEFLDSQESLTATEEEGEYIFNHVSVSNSMGPEDESDIFPRQYADTLILFRFSDCILPMKLKEIVMSDLRLLTLLEAGLPAWVIFFQSYPLFCHFYLPWMRHLMRTLYILMSLVTVIIGFYDLYKNVPILKATVARFSGPLFGWIEGWDMVTRIHYLGTMLFLQNLEKGLKWFMLMSRSTRALLSTIAKPLSGPFYEVIEAISPLWNACAEACEMLSSTVWFMVTSISDAFLDFVEFVFSPFELLYSCISSIAMSIYPFICTIWDLVLAPIRCTFTVADYLSIFLLNTFDLLKDIWESVSGIFQIKALSEGTQRSAYDLSIWQGLWKDIFSQIFRATRSVVNGMSAFFMACNRHRLSTYNYIRAFLQRMACLAHITRRRCRCQQAPQLGRQHEIDADYKECDRCK